MSATPTPSKSSEQALVLWMFFHSFSIGIFIAFYFSTANSLFIEDWTSDKLPLSYLVGGGFGILLVNVYSRLQGRLSEAKLFQLVFFFTAGVLVLFALLLQANIMDRSILSFGLLILSVPLITLSGLETSGLTLLLFDLRQSKKYFALFNTGNIVASIIGYLSIPLLVGRLQIPEFYLLWFAVIGCVGGWLTLQIILRRFHQPDLTEAEEVPPEELALETEEATQEVPAKLLSNPYLRLIASSTILSMIAIYFVDFGFTDALSLNYPGEPEAFLSAYAAFFSIVKVGELIFSLLSGKILARFSIRFGLVFVPIAMLICTLLAFSAQYLTELLSNPLIVLLVVFYGASKWLNLVGISSFEVPATRLLFMALPANQRTSVQTKIDGNVEQLGTGIAGVLLLAFTHFFEVGADRLTLFAILTLPLLIVWAYLAFKLYGAYRIQLSRVLESSSNTEEELTKFSVLPTLSGESPSLHAWRNLLDTEVLLPSKNRSDLAKYLIMPKVQLRQRLQEGIRDGSDEVPAIMLNLAQMRDRKSIPVMVDLLRHSRYAHAAMTVLPLYHAQALPDLGYAFERATEVSLRHKIIRIYQQIGTDEIRKRLLQLIDYHEPPIRRSALQALNDLGVKVLVTEQEQIRSLILKELEVATWLYSVQADLAPLSNEVDIFQRLDRQILQSKTTILQLLGLFYGPEKLGVVQKYLFDEDNPEQRIFALELLDNLLDNVFKPQLVPLFDDRPAPRKLKALRPLFPQDHLSVPDRLIEILLRNQAFAGLMVPLVALNLPIDSERKAVKLLRIAMLHYEPMVVQRAAQILYYERDDPQTWEKALTSLTPSQRAVVLDLLEDLSANYHHEIIGSLIRLPGFAETSEAWLSEVTSLVHRLRFAEASVLKNSRDLTLENQFVWITRGGLQTMDRNRNRRVIATGQALFIPPDKNLLEDFTLKALPDTELLLMPSGKFIHLLLTDRTMAEQFIKSAPLTQLSDLARSAAHKMNIQPPVFS